MTQKRPSMERVLQLKAEGDQNRAKIAQLEEDIKQIKLANDQVESAFEQELEWYAKADCLQFSQIIYAKLPTELRDLVYEYLCIEEQNVPVGSHHFTHYGLIYYYEHFDGRTYYVGDDQQPIPCPDRNKTSLSFISELVDTSGDAFTVLPDGRIQQNHSVIPQSGTPQLSSQFLNPVWVGLAVAQEVSKTFFSSNCFSMCSVEDTIRDFLLTDASHNFEHSGQSHDAPKLTMGVLPLDHVTDLEIRIKCEHYLVVDTDVWNAPSADIYAGDRRFINDIHKNLRPIWHDLVQRQQQNPTKKLSVHIIIMKNLTEKRDSLNFLEAIRHMVYSLKYSANDLTNVDVEIYNETIQSPFPQKINHAFSLTKKQWEYEQAANIQAFPNYTPSPLRALVGSRCLKPHELLEGFHHDELDQVLAQRWGIDFIVDAEGVVVRSAVKEGPYWPLAKGSKKNTSDDHRV